jgi:hypothetical protein
MNAEITRSSSLHAIADAIMDAAVVNDDGEFTPESIAALDALQLTLEQKVEAYAFVYAELTTQACARKELAAYYERRAFGPKAAAERLKERLKGELERLGMKEIKTPTCKVTLEASPECVELIKGQAVPPAYQRSTPEPDKTAIKAALKNGAVFDFAKLTRGQHVRFR